VTAAFPPESVYSLDISVRMRYNKATIDPIKPEDSMNIKKGVPCAEEPFFYDIDDEKHYTSAAKTKPAERAAGLETMYYSMIVTL